MSDLKDHDILVDLSARFDAFASEMRDKVNTFLDGHRDHETRIRLLEKDSFDFKGQMKGATKTSRMVYSGLTLIVLALSVVVAWLAIVK